MKPEDRTDVATEFDLVVAGRTKLARKLRKKTQQELAKHLGVSFQIVQKYEAGEVRIPSGRLKQIADVLQLPIDFFYLQDVAVENIASIKSAFLEEKIDVASQILGFQQKQDECLRLLAKADEKDAEAIALLLRRLQKDQNAA